MMLASWSITTPDESLESAWIYVDLVRVPDDQNKGQPANVLQGRDSVAVSVLASWLTTALGISSPAGAMDDTLSTEQVFVVKAVLDWSNVEDITARIELPYGYETEDDPIKKMVCKICT